MAFGTDQWSPQSTQQRRFQQQPNINEQWQGAALGQQEPMNRQQQPDMSQQWFRQGQNPQGGRPTRFNPASSYYQGQQTQQRPNYRGGLEGSPQYSQFSQLGEAFSNQARQMQAAGATPQQIEAMRNQSYPQLDQLGRGLGNMQRGIGPTNQQPPGAPYGSPYSQSGQGFDPTGYQFTDPNTGQRRTLNQPTIQQYYQMTGNLPSGQMGIGQQNYLLGQYGYDQFGNPTMGREQMYGNLYGYGPGGQQSLPGRQQALAEETQRGNLYGYNLSGDPTIAGRQQTAAEQQQQFGQGMTTRQQEEAELQARFGRGVAGAELTGQYEGGDTLAGRQRAQAEQESRAGMSGYYEGPGGRQATMGRQQWETGETGYMPGGQATMGRQFGEAGLTGRYGDVETLAGRGQSLSELRESREDEFRRAQMAANPENAATVAALRGQAPWQQAVSGGGGGQWGGAVPNPREMNLQRFDTMNPSERGAFGSFARAGGGSMGDYEQQLQRYRPQRTQASTASWS